MPLYAALIYTPDLDWTAPEQAETAARTPSSARTPATTSAAAPRCSPRPPPPPSA